MAEENNEKTASHAMEFEANTAEEAIKAALKKLNLPKEKIKIQILTEGKRGLFGMQGAKKAKIKVTILTDEQEP